MQDNDNTTKIEQVNSFVEKWALIVLVLPPYLIYSFKIIDSITTPNPTTGVCGNEFLGPIIAHIMLASLSALILGLKLTLGKGYTLLHKIVVFSIIFIPPVITILILCF